MNNHSNASKSSDQRASQLLDTLRRVVADPTIATTEHELQKRLAAGLGRCDLELRTTFEAPAHTRITPPRSAILALEKKGRKIPTEGRDPCTQRGKLDLLWHNNNERVPIELKFVPERKSDVWGYQFLKHLHRLERLIAVDGCPDLAKQRFAAFVTSEPVYWRGGRPEPAPFCLRDGHVTAEKSWIQYDQPSPDTLWYSYPPFYLANAYKFDWQDVAKGFRVLLVEVTPQKTTACVGA